MHPTVHARMQSSLFSGYKYIFSLAAVQLVFKSQPTLKQTALVNATGISVNMWNSATAKQNHFSESLSQEPGFPTLTTPIKQAI